MDFDFVGQVKDYIIYCYSVNRVLANRDFHQMEHEYLSSTLEAKLQEREGANPQSKSVLSSLMSTDPEKLQASINEVSPFLFFLSFF